MPCRCRGASALRNLTTQHRNKFSQYFRYFASYQNHVAIEVLVVVLRSGINIFLDHIQRRRVLDGQRFGQNE